MAVHKEQAATDVRSELYYLLSYAGQVVADTEALLEQADSFYRRYRQMVSEVDPTFNPRYFLQSLLRSRRATSRAAVREVFKSLNRGQQAEVVRALSEQLQLVTSE